MSNSCYRPATNAIAAATVAATATATAAATADVIAAATVAATATAIAFTSKREVLSIYVTGSQFCECKRESCTV